MITIDTLGVAKGHQPMTDYPKDVRESRNSNKTDVHNELKVTRDGLSHVFSPENGVKIGREDL